MKLIEIITRTLEAARLANFAVEADSFGGVSISFDAGSWYVSPEENGVYMQGDDVRQFERDYAALLALDEAQDIPTDDLREYAACKAIDFA